MINPNPNDAERKLAEELVRFAYTQEQKAATDRAANALASHRFTSQNAVLAQAAERRQPEPPVFEAIRLFLASPGGQRFDLLRENLVDVVGHLDALAQRCAALEVLVGIRRADGEETTKPEVKRART